MTGLVTGDLVCGAPEGIRHRVTEVFQKASKTAWKPPMSIRLTSLSPSKSKTSRPSCTVVGGVGAGVPSGPQKQSWNPA